MKKIVFLSLFVSLFAFASEEEKNKEFRLCFNDIHSNLIKEFDEVIYKKNKNLVPTNDIKTEITYKNDWKVLIERFYESTLEEDKDYYFIAKTEIEFYNSCNDDNYGADALIEKEIKMGEHIEK